MFKPKGKIGIGITTYNSESYFKDLYNSIQGCSVDDIVVVNGGDPYSSQYNCNWLQHSSNYYPAICRNDCINFLLNRQCEHIFLIEDDMIIKDKNIFNQYIKASRASGLRYFSFVSTSSYTGSPDKRTPKLTVEYKNNVKICLYQNMCNEFTYHHYTCFETTGTYDSQFRDPFDIDLAYRESKQDYCAPFWWFADIEKSDDYICNNPVAVSRLQSEDRPDGSREQRIMEQWRLFELKHKIQVNQIPCATKDQVISKLKVIQQKYGNAN